MEEKGRLERRGPTLQRRSRTSGRANSASAAARVPRKTTATTTSRPSNRHPLAPPWRCSGMVAWCFASASSHVAIDPGPRDRDPSDRLRSENAIVKIARRRVEIRSWALRSLLPVQITIACEAPEPRRVSYTEKVHPEKGEGTGRRTTAAGHLSSRPSDETTRALAIAFARGHASTVASHAGNDELDKPGYARPKHGGLDEHWAHGVLLR